MFSAWWTQANVHVKYWSTASTTSLKQQLTQTTGLSISTRVRLIPESDARRGTIAYIGAVPEIPGIGVWVGVTLDEPTGKNDGSVRGKRYFQCGNNCGAFVRPERCEAGDFPALDLSDEDMEEL
jgi:tubulin-folding cofactor B